MKQAIFSLSSATWRFISSFFSFGKTSLHSARDVRQFEIDTVEIYNSFRPGDIVRALVISRGDARSYYLSTARNDLGVVSAPGRGGRAMIPLSWDTMQCPVTLAKEKRKVAKVDFAPPQEITEKTEDIEASKNMSDSSSA